MSKPRNMPAAPRFPIPRPTEFDPGSPVGVESSSSPSSAFPSSDPSPPSSSSSSLCPFCHIAATYPAYDPTRPPADDSPLLSPEATSTSPENPAAYVVLSTALAIAFLDIQPLSRGHLLVCPRAHRPKLTDATAAEARELGLCVRALSAALAAATGVADWNVVQNNGAAAAQVVPHAHFHVIPRPGLGDRRHGGGERFTATMFGRGAREDLDPEEAGPLAARIRGALVGVFRELGVDGEGQRGSKI